MRKPKPDPNDPHGYFNMIQLDQGWKTGFARCQCGVQFTVTLTIDKKNRAVLDPGQGCPESPKS
jgi:hypothetical protein